MRRLGWAAAAAGLALAAVGCSKGGGGGAGQTATAVPVTVATAAGTRSLTAEVAATAAQQEKGLMFRTGLGPGAAMLFWPYPPEGGAPRQATFWMKNTPTPLDIVFIRADGTVARIAENAVPFSEAPISSGEPVAAVLEIVGGRAAELGIAEGDHVDWPGRR